LRKSKKLDTTTRYGMVVTKRVKQYLAVSTSIVFKPGHLLQFTR